MRLTVRGERDASLWQLMGSGVRGTVIFLVLALVGLITPSEDGDPGLFWAALDGKWGALEMTVIILAAAASWGGWEAVKERRARRDKVSSTLELDAFALVVSEQRIPWHEVTKARNDDGDVVVEWSSGTSRIRAAGHSTRDVNRLIAAIRDQAETTRATEDERRALHEAADALRQKR